MYFIYIIHTQSNSGHRKQELCGEQSPVPAWHPPEMPLLAGGVRAPVPGAAGAAGSGQGVRGGTTTYRQDPVYQY